MNRNKVISHLVPTFIVFLIFLAIGSFRYLMISEKLNCFHRGMNTFQENLLPAAREVRCKSGKQRVLHKRLWPDE